MKVLEFGDFFSTIESFPFISTKTLLEYDMVILDFEYITRGSSNTHTPQYERRKKQLAEFVQFKNIPLVFFTPHEDYFYTAGGRKSLDFLAPIPKFEIQREEGTQVSVKTNTPFYEFLTKYKEHIHYVAYFTSRPGQIIVETPLTKHPLGFWDMNCVILPRFKNITKEKESEVLKDLYSALKKSRSSQPKAALPEWTAKFLLPNEEKLSQEIHQLNTEIEALKVELQNKKNMRDALANRKLLFTGTGVELEQEVETVLREIGFEVLEAEDNREDLIVKYEEKFAVIEVKGVSGTSAERHAAQLEKWSAEFFERTGNKPKPILIVNAFKDLPLNERTEDTFPNQMLKYSESRDHCLMSTLQLLFIYFSINEDKNTKKDLIEKMLSTVGVFQEFKEWNSFISFDS